METSTFGTGNINLCNDLLNWLLIDNIKPDIILGKHSLNHWKYNIKFYLSAVKKFCVFSINLMMKVVLKCIQIIFPSCPITGTITPYNWNGTIHEECMLTLYKKLVIWVMSLWQWCDCLLQTCRKYSTYM